MAAQPMMYNAPPPSGGLPPGSGNYQQGYGAPQQPGYTPGYGSQPPMFAPCGVNEPVGQLFAGRHDC